MIYTESFRHFVQEWIEIQHPSIVENMEWPWDTNSRLFLVNLYPVSSSDPFTSLPQPLISILVDGLEDENPPIINDRESLFKQYFEQDIFQLPRRYIYDPLNRGNRSFKLNRYSFTSDGYGDMASNWHKEDLRFIRLLAHRPHVRYSIYDSSDAYKLRCRLDRLEAVSQATIKWAENIFDFTSYAAKQSRYSPELMLIQAPILGLLKPIKKSREYRIINGALVLCSDPVRMTIPEEPCANEYIKSMVPFKHINRGTSMGQGNEAKAIVYVAVEVPCGVFTFQEFTPNHTIESSTGDSYVRVLNHHFTIVPELSDNRKGIIDVRLGHSIVEGLIPNIKANKGFFAKKNEKLFHRSDLPAGFIKSPGSKTVTVQME